MGIMDRLNDIFKGEEEYDENEEFEGYEEEEEVAAPAPVAAPKAAPASRSTGSISSSALEMKVVKPERFDEVPNNLKVKIQEGFQND